MSWTKKDLKRCHELYERNWVKLVKYLNTPKGKHYIKRENRLEALCVEIQEYLKIRVQNPCPLKSYRRCYDCTGYVKDGKMVNSGKDQCQYKDTQDIFCYISLYGPQNKSKKQISAS